MPARARAGTPTAFVWAGRKADDVGAVTAARERRVDAAEDEYRRLLYVAMTRAADRLVVCGATGERATPRRLLVRPGAQRRWRRHALEEAADDGDGRFWRFRKTPCRRRTARPPRAAAAARSGCRFRLGSTRNAPPIRAVRRRCRPRSAYDETVVVRTRQRRRRRARKALARGTRCTA